jgi:ribonuclease P protein component
LVLQKLSKPIFSSKSIRVFVVKSSEPGLRVSTPKKLFKLAVKRNKIKRQIKNIFQKNNLYKDDLVFVVMVFTPFLSLSYKEASFEICKAVKS